MQGGIDRPAYLPLFKPLFQYPTIIRKAFIAVVIKKQAKRQAVRFPMLDNAVTAFAMVWASQFRASALFHICTRHGYLTSMQSPQQSGTQVPHPVHLSLSISIQEPGGSSSSSIHEIALAGQSVSGLQIRLSKEHMRLSM